MTIPTQDTSIPDTAKIAAIGAAVAAAYASLQLISNIASLRVGILFGIAVDLGTFCYPFTFTLRDLAHKTLGLKAVKWLIWTSALICLFATGYFALCAKMPGVGSDGTSEVNAFNLVFSPMWRIVIASLLAMVLSELADTQIYQFIMERTSRHQWLRVLASNSVSIPLDNIIFAVVAFGWVLPWNMVFQVFFVNLIIKAIVGLLAVPLIYIVPSRDGEK